MEKIYCRRKNKDIYKAVCICRHDMANDPNPAVCLSASRSGHNNLCLGCEQGRAIKAEFEDSVKAVA